MPNNAPQQLTRSDLAKFLPDQRSIRVFEKLFELSAQQPELQDLVDEIIQLVGKHESSIPLLSTKNLEDLKSLYTIIFLISSSSSTRYNTQLNEMRKEINSIKNLISINT